MNPAMPELIPVRIWFWLFYSLWFGLILYRQRDDIKSGDFIPLIVKVCLALMLFLIGAKTFGQLFQ